MNDSRPLIILGLLLLLLPGCAPPRLSGPVLSADDADRVKRIFADIDEQNSTVKKSDTWLRDAYAAVRIKRLNDIPPADYARYRRFVENGSVYIIVHPAYYPYFDIWNIPRPAPDYREGLPAKNIMERIRDGISPAQYAYRATHEQERIVRDFLEYISYDKKLAILVLPRDHRTHATYGQQDGYDEYARYINEMTNRSENIIYLESASFDKGQLRQEDRELLLQFFKDTGVRTVLLGGGFMGRCLDGFYGTLRTLMFSRNIVRIPELTVFSPTDLARDRRNLLTETGRISPQALMGYFREFAYDEDTEELHAWQAFPLYPVYDNR